MRVYEMEMICSNGDILDLRVVGYDQRTAIFVLVGKEKEEMNLELFAKKIQLKAWQVVAGFLINQIK